LSEAKSRRLDGGRALYKVAIAGHSASNTRVNALMTPQVGFTVAPALAMLQLS
jgi:hypothetical protein